jgi:hypothetical protein
MDFYSGEFKLIWSMLKMVYFTRNIYAYSTYIFIKLTWINKSKYFRLMVLMVYFHQTSIQMFDVWHGLFKNIAAHTVLKCNR